MIKKNIRNFLLIIAPLMSSVGCGPPPPSPSGKKGPSAAPKSVPIPPDSAATLTDGPSNPSAATELNALVGGNGVTEYQYALQSGGTCVDAKYGDFRPVATRITGPVGLDGEKVLCIRWKDSLGNVSTEGTTFTWVKSTALPIALFSDLPNRTSAATALNVLVGGDRATDYQYALVNAVGCEGAHYTEFRSLTNRITTVLGGDGVMTLCAKAKDALGNIQEVPTAYTWTKETLAHTASIIDRPTNPSPSETLNILVGGQDVSHYQYALQTSSSCEGAVYTTEFFPVSTRINASLGMDGTKAICIKGKDSSGTIQNTPTIYTWIKDTVAPTATLADTPTNPSASTSLNVLVGGIGVIQYQFVLQNASNCDGAVFPATFLPAATRITSPIGADGLKTLCVKGKDIAGNIQATPLAFSWTKDTVAPTVTLSDAPTNPSASTTLNVLVGGTGVIQYQFVLRNASNCDGAVFPATFLPVATRITSAIGTDGSKTLCVKGKDIAGNIQATPLAFSWTKDTVAPTVTLADAPTNPSASTTLNVLVGGTGVTQYQFALRNASNHPFLTPCEAGILVL